MMIRNNDAKADTDGDVVGNVSTSLGLFLTLLLCSSLNVRIKNVCVFRKSIDWQWLSNLLIKVFTLAKQQQPKNRLKQPPNKTSSIHCLYKKRYFTAVATGAVICTYFALPSRVQIATPSKRLSACADVHTYTLRQSVLPHIQYCTNGFVEVGVFYSNCMQSLFVSPLRSYAREHAEMNVFFPIDSAQLNVFFSLYFPSLRATKYFHYTLHEHHRANGSNMECNVCMYACGGMVNVMVRLPLLPLMLEV